MTGVASPHSVRVAGLQITVTALCAAMGALMLVVPHQLGHDDYAALRPHLVWWGAGSLAAAVAIASVTLFAVPRLVDRLVHAAGGIFLAALGTYFLRAGSSPGFATLCVLGAATAACPFLAAARHKRRPGGQAAHRSEEAADLLALVSGLVAVFIGVTMVLSLVFPAVSGYERVRGNVLVIGLALVAAGTLQCAAQLQDARRRMVSLAGHALTGAAFVAYVVATAEPSEAWIGVLVFGALAALVGAQPWLGPHVSRLRAGTLGTRLGFALCLGASLPLIGAVALHSRKDLDTTASVIAVFHRSAAEKMARDIGQGLTAYQGAAGAIAAAPGLFAQTPDAQAVLLRRLSLTPEPLEVTLFNPTGEILARRNGLGAAESNRPDIVEKVRASREPAYDVVTAALSGRPSFRFAAPALDARGTLLGVVEVDVDAFVDVLGSQDVGDAPRVYLLDGAGRVMAHLPPKDPGDLTKPAGPPAIWQRLDGGRGTGEARYDDAGQDWVAGYARVPNTPWTVVVERPATAALATLYEGQERALALLAVAVVLAVVAGALVARRLVAPLRTLADAVERLGAGETGAPLPVSGIEEVAHLARSFGRMREQLARRAAERERATERLEMLLGVAATLAETDDLPAAVEAALGEVVRAIRVVDMGAVFSYDADAMRLMPVACAGLDREAFTRLHLRSGEGAVGHAFATGETVRLDTAARRSMSALSADSARLVDELVPLGLRDGVALPLRTQSGELIGAAVFASTTSELGAEDRQLLEGITVQFGIAVRSGQLLAQAQRQAEALRGALTDLRGAEQQMVQQERLRAVGEMASGIAHDLNNALAPVVGFTELILRDPGALTPVQHAWLRLVHTGALDAAGVVSRLREVYRARGGDEAYDGVDLRLLVQQVVALTRPKWRDDALAGGRTIDVMVELPAEPVEVWGNAAELREAVTNLVFNAVDATPARGTITLRVAPEGEGGTISVTDTGIGMSEQDRRRCLEPFFTTKGERGTGLGLSMLHGTMERHGGAVEIESAVGAGSTFKLRLPLAPPAAGERGVQGDAPAVIRPLRILVVDDEEVVRHVIVACLEADGHTVDSVDSPEAAIESVMETSVYDVLITDRAMPGMPGDALATRVKAERPGLPVIMVTGYGDLMNAAGERPAAVDVVIAKPVTLARLRAALTAVVAASARAVAT